MKERLDPAAKRILLIEDNEDVLRPLAFRLRKKGYKVSIAQDGRRGLTVARLSFPHLIILDLDLPLLPGEEVCKAIREDDNQALNRIPIIMLTAKSSEVDRIVGKVIGATTYVTKPYDPNELLIHIESHLSLFAES